MPSKNSYLASIPIEHLDLPLIHRNALLRAGLRSALDVQRLIEADELRSIHNIGVKSIQEIESQIRLLLENDAVVLASDETDAIGIETSEYLQTRQKIFYGFPIEILSEILGVEVVRRLRSTQLTTVGEVIEFCERIIGLIGESSTSHTWMMIYQKEIIRSAIAEGKLHPLAHLYKSNISLKDVLVLQPLNDNEEFELLALLADIARHKSLTDELIDLFAEISNERDVTAFARYFHDRMTLEQVGRKESLTRERVRQIIGRVTFKLWQKVSFHDFLFLRSSLLFALELGDNLSLDSWRLLLEERGIISSEMVYRDLTTFDALCALLRCYEKNKAFPVIEIDDNLQIVLDSASNLPLGLIKALESLPSQTKREIQRIVSYVGGIHLSQAADMLEVQVDYATHILRHLGFKEISGGWFTLVSSDVIVARWPILKAGLAMMEVCGPLEFESFCDGIRRYVSRFFDVLAPPDILAVHFDALGFQLEEDLVSWPESPKGYLADSDMLFVSFADEHGPIVSFPEIVGAFQENGFSPATATSRVLPQSPVVEKVGPGLYKIRGRKHSYVDIENARNRQEQIDYNPEVVYGVDGIVRYRVTIGTWALNGVISISAGQQPLPNSDGWSIFVNGKAHGKAGQDEYLIWGLTSAFRTLEVMIGDRIEIEFDAWQEPQMRVSKISDDTTE